ncbi:MAG: 50S ribosomal protein L18 [Berkelbacteria bacterium GW2011_GWA2_46_7]|uniref:Large ribosomal subunit protein uL18 n=1 Tax=Berkelbacteria bacterium GW2011_GWA2_46_7 TaxID=1618335 RepID=A0A0G1QGS1_9BACT|nr:MAG: 50S ribosomal protein L18 [Berkelbacteria bacterium GW2011_GWA2_46_7]
MNNRQRTRRKIRQTVIGTATRPRLAVFRSLTNLSAQIINDSTGKTLVSASSIKEKGTRTNKAKFVGGQIAKNAKEAKIKSVVFDRSGFVYQGVIQILADEARRGGLEF